MFNLVIDKPDRTLGCSRVLAQWIAAIGLDPSFVGTHSLRRIRATLIYCRTGKCRAPWILHWWHGNSTVALNMPRYMRYEAAIQNRADGSGGFTWLMSRSQRRPCARAARRHRLLHRKDQSSAAQ